jgi:DNA-binding GntR family transcriptional regulator
LEPSYPFGLLCTNGDEALEEMITCSHTIAQRYTHIYMRMNPDEVETQDEHRAILAAYRGRDIEAAVALMDQHISVACARFAAFLKNVGLSS